MLRLSFILPCYNVAPYIGRCLDSIEHQDIPQSDYEVICVDDCSKDNSVDVIRGFQKQYDNIRLICHKENKTAGGARNTGLDAAQGDYIWFVDPDDSVVENTIAGLYTKAQSNKLDILFFNKQVCGEDGKKISKNPLPEISEATKGQEFFMRYFPDKRMASITSVWAELFSRDFIVKNSIRFPEIKSSQDVVFLWRSFLLAERVLTDKAVAYNHYRRSDSTTGSVGKFKAKHVISSSLLYVDELGKIIEVPMEERLRNDILFGMRNAVNDNSRKVFRMSGKERRLFYDEMKKYADLIERHKRIMNRKTKHIFNYRLPYYLWLFMIYCYKFKDRVLV